MTQTRILCLHKGGHGLTWQRHDANEDDLEQYISHKSGLDTDEFLLTSSDIEMNIIPMLKRYRWRYLVNP